MRLPAKAFLPPGVADQYLGLMIYSIEQLPEAEYIASLREALRERGVVYLHMSYWAQHLRTPSGWEDRRVYYVRSFVWQGHVFIVRLSTFRKSDFETWPAQLQAIWQEVMLEVPEQPITLP
jgi:hypothetical protein